MDFTLFGFLDMALVRPTHYALDLEPGTFGLAADGVQVLHCLCWKIFISYKGRLMRMKFKWLFFYGLRQEMKAAD